MVSTKFYNEEIHLTIRRINYGQYMFTIDTGVWELSKYCTDSILVDAINSDDDEENDWGTRQDAIDTAVEMVLDANGIEYELSK